MNERIKDLWETSNEIKVRYPEQGSPVSVSAETLEKFAELIIKQCIDQIEIERGNPYRNMGDENKYGISACDQSISRIKQHFEIK